MLRTPVLDPLIRPGPLEPGLGRDHEAFRIRVQRLSNESFCHLRAIGVRGVEQVYTELESTMQNRKGFFVVFGLAPDAFSGEPHSAETEAIDLEVAADSEHG